MQSVVYTYLLGRADCSRIHYSSFPNIPVFHCIFHIANMHIVVYNTPLYHLLLLSVLYPVYIIIKLLSYYYYLIIIFFPHGRRDLHDPILVPNKPNIIIIIYTYI